MHGLGFDLSLTGLLYTATLVPGGKLVSFEVAVAVEDEMIEAILEWVDTEDFGDREPRGDLARQELLLIGTDDEVRGLMERDRQRERLYVSRNDERLMLNENHEDYLMENEE